MVRDLVKLCQNPMQKTKLVATKQLDDLLYQLNKQTLSVLGPSLQKSVNKMISEERNPEVG